MLSVLSLGLAVLAADDASRTLELRAERVLHDGARKRTTAEGNAHLVGDGTALSADRITWDEESQTAVATGNVALRLVKAGLVAVTADAVSVRFDGSEAREIFLYQGLAVRKKGTTPAALLAAQTPADLDATGTVGMTLTGSHLVHDGRDWVADDIVFVPCDCDFADPMWGIHASRARADFDAERVSLLFPTVKVKGVPVLWLPWISLPLTSRQTGLLVPHPSFSGLNGFAIEQPLFITLGQSADLTLTGGYFFGNPASVFGIKGPRLLTEFRYTPNWQTSGRITLGLLYDLRERRDPIEAGVLACRDSEGSTYVACGDPSAALLPEVRGLRGEATVQHHQALDRWWHLNVDGSLLTDGYYLRDVTADVLAREAFYLRSTAALFRRSEDVWLGLDVLLRQDVSSGYELFRRSPVVIAGKPERADQGAPIRGPNPFHRLPALTLAVPERPLWGPLSWSVRAEYVRLAPVSGLSGDEGPIADEGRATALANGETVALSAECVQQRLYWPVAYDAAKCPDGVAAPNSAKPLDGEPDTREHFYEGDRTWQPGERQARDRFDLKPELRLGGVVANALSLSAAAAWRQDVWLGEADGSARWRGYPLLTGRAGSELARSYPIESGVLRHTLAASVELRGSPVVLGAAPVPYDEVDAAWPDATPRLQAVAELRQRLLSKTAAGVQEHLRLDLGQGAELLGPDGPRVAESFGRLGTRAGWLTADVSVRVDAPRGRVTRVSATAGLDDGGGRGLYAAWENVLDDGTDRTRQPIDLLFGPRAGPGNARAQGLSFGGRFRYQGFTVRYDALMFNRTYVIAPVLEELPGGRAPTGTALTFVQHSLGVGYGPRCECWRLEVYASQHSTEAPGQSGPPSYLAIPDFGATLTLTGFGAFGTGG